ncbi:SusC/RagA family TonB-linked outer membrane protein [Sphingobacterium spiritivorum]|uniref:SusC/RagA family TonB-linked outer membrane protein n=1 Tax=Sphingobacterium spiritivorum TaxID=258 RepID=UPI003DA51354
MANLIQKLYWTFLTAFLTFSHVNAQQSISGRVTNPEGIALSGVTVSVKSSTRATKTDAQGIYSIRAESGETLRFSIIGFLTKEVPISNQAQLNINLETNTSSIDEVVVTALGQKREKRALGYSITEIKGDDIANANTTNPINALQGKVAGVQINMGSSGPQSSQRILIRGNTSISGNNQPIFVIDGVIINNETTKGSEKLDRDFGNDIKNLNSDDFESVSILKGAAATALYGSRASNGVILITSKKGKKSQGLGINISHTQQLETVYGVPKLQNEFGQGATTVWNLDNQGQAIRNVLSDNRSFGPKFDNLPYTVDGGLYNSIFQAHKNNLLDLYQTGRFQNTNIAIANGTEKSTYRFSYSNLNTKGITEKNNFKRNSFSLNASHEISSVLNATAGFNYVNSSTQNPTYQGEAFSPIFDFVYSLPREYDINYWRKNYKSANNDGYNPDDPWNYSSKLYEYLENNQLQDEDNFRANLNLEFKFTNWLRFVLKGDIYKLFTTNEIKKMADGTAKFSGSKYQLQQRTKDQYSYSGLLSANRSIDNFNIGISLGAETWQSKGSIQTSVTNNGLIKPGLFDLTNSIAPATTSGRRNYNTRKINSVYGFINLDWKNQIYLDITGRNDWSSTLIYSDGSGNASYFYPSISSSWIASETFSSILPDYINYTKLRASYAIVGKDTDPYTITTPGTYKYTGLFTDNLFGAGNLAYYGFANTMLGAINLKPEKQYAMEFGLELKLFNNRLGFDFAYYKTNTKNQILALASPIESGVTSKLINAGNIQNKGFEILFEGTPFKMENFSWDLSINFTKNKNKIIKLADGVSVYQLNGGGAETGSYATEGGAYGDIYSNQAYLRDKQNSKILTSNGVYIQAGKSTKIGSLQPNFLSGLSSSLRYRSFSLNTLFDARFGGDIFSTSFNYGMYNGTLQSSLKGRTTETGGLPRTLSDGRIVYDGMIPEGIFRQGVRSDDNTTDLSGKSYQWAYENGYKKPISAADYYNNVYSWGTGIREASIFKSSWIALREVSLHWNIPSKLIKSAFIKNANIGFSVRNLGFLYNSLPDNINPEGLATTYGSEYKEGGGAPLSRNYSMKINLIF